MKQITLIIALMSFVIGIAQDIEEVRINKDVSTHFISDEKLSYTDLSSDLVVGDYPLENILRIKPKLEGKSEYGYVTIVGESFFRQYRLVYVPDATRADKKVDIDRAPKYNYVNPSWTLTSVDMKNYMKRMHSMKPKLAIKGKRQNKMQLVLNNIWVVGEHYFVDYSIKNRTNIQYDIDEVRFKIKDKKVEKASNSQDIALNPILKFHKLSSFDKNMRQVVVLKKFTFPDEKEFRIEINEDQISGRAVTLDISYKEILRARRLPVPNKKIASR